MAGITSSNSQGIRQQPNYLLRMLGRDNSAEATVKTRIHRGRERLRERLRPYRGELRQAEKVGAL